VGWNCTNVAAVLALHMAATHIEGTLYEGVHMKASASHVVASVDERLQDVDGGGG